MITLHEKARSKAYHEAHHEEHKARCRAYYEAHREERKAYREAHREEHKAWYRAYHEAHREERKAYRKAHREEANARTTMERYRVSFRDAEMLNALRDGAGTWCDICRTTEGPFNIDHSHKTGRIRGILCSSCNVSVGVLDNGFPVDLAYEYLKERSVAT